MQDTEFDPGAKNQDQNKRKFRQDYGVEQELPGFYIVDARVYPSDLSYVVRLIKHRVPTGGDYTVTTYALNEEPVTCNVDELQGPFFDLARGDHLTFQLMKANEDALVILKEFPIEIDTKSDLRFS